MLPCRRAPGLFGAVDSCEQGRRSRMTEPSQSLKSVVLRWVLPTSAALVFGPLAAWPIGELRDAGGGLEATAVLSASPLMGVLAILFVALVAGVGGGITARLTLAGTGRTFAGLVVVWAAMRTGDSWLMLTEHGGGAVVPLVLEGVVVAVVGLVMIAGLISMGEGKPLRAGFGEISGSVRGKGAGLGILIGVVGGLVATLLVALDGMRGQCLFGGIAAGVLCAVGVQGASPETPGEVARVRASVATLLLAVIGPLTLLFMPGGGEIASAARAGTLTGPGIVQPLDWLAGVFLGVPTGMAWIGSVSERAQASAGGAQNMRPKRAS